MKKDKTALVDEELVAPTEEEIDFEYEYHKLEEQLNEYSAELAKEKKAHEALKARYNRLIELYNGVVEQYLSK